MNNYNLCHIKTINWKEIITGQDARYLYVYRFAEPERDCTPCHESCEAGCWGEGVHNCQKFSKMNCSPQCGGGRCFGPRPRECCHQYCAGGCTGPTQSDCLVGCHGNAIKGLYWTEATVIIFTHFIIYPVSGELGEEN